jgi:phosphatidylserine/phosphatidylglycerophosphate/cardiolipin synthase-like enzyme
MRVRAEQGSLEILAIAGTRCVLVAMNLPAAEAKGLLGFAIARRKGSTGAFRYLEGKKVFRSVVPAPEPEAEFPSNVHPIQSFLWSTYTAEPGTTYAFRVEALFGAPGAIDVRHRVAFEVKTESETEGLHRVWFNRGAIASQAFAETFENKSLSDEEKNDPASKETKWLSRGLLEACLAFIDDTRDDEGLRVAAYEFTYPPVLEALKAAIDRGVDVRIVYGADDDNDRAIEKVGVPRKKGNRQILTERTNAKIPHNKFLVRLVGGKPKVVWTGSTNFTPSGFLGQTNVGHVVVDDRVARDYLKYWEVLKRDPERAEGRDEVMTLTPDPENVGKLNGIVRVFSPRHSSAMRKWYAQRIVNARNCVLFTGAFGIDPVLLKALGTEGPAMRFILLERPPSKEIRDAQKRNKGDIQLSYGAVLGKRNGRNEKGKLTKKLVPIPNFAIEEWFLEEDLERKSGEGFVFFVHTKFLLIDPLSDDPLLCTGSANFSDESLLGNDENMLLIRGDTKTADIYMTEFDRIFRHFYFRAIANRDPSDESKFLDEKDKWWRAYYRPTNVKCCRREMFFSRPDDTWAEQAEADDSPFA